MHAHKLQITIPENHRGEISFHLPDDFPSGPAEVIILSSFQSQATTRSSQSRAAALKELLSFQRTPEEEKVLDNFESFSARTPI